MDIRLYRCTDLTYVSQEVVPVDEFQAVIREFLPLIKYFLYTYSHTLIIIRNCRTGRY